MIYPSADTIEDKIDSRYSLVVLAAKRAKQIKEGSPVLIDTLSTNPLTIALEEIAAGKVTVAKPGLGRPTLEDDEETDASALYLSDADADDGESVQDLIASTGDVLAADDAAGE